MYYQPFDRSMGLWIINEFWKISRKFTLGDYILNFHDLEGWISIDITGRNLMLITVRA